MLPSLDSARSRPTRLLVADDDPTTLLLLQQVLQGDGYEVETASSGEDALFRFQCATPDLVLLDITMPGMDGLVTCERMRQLDPHRDVPIIVLTGAAGHEMVDRAMAAHATDFLTKPFQWRLLLQRIRYAVRSGRLNRELRLDRARQSAARRMARLIFFHWDLDHDTLTWSEGHLPVSGTPVSTPQHFEQLVELASPADRTRIDRLIRRSRLYGETLDLEFEIEVEGETHVLRLAGQPGDIGADRRVVSGALQDISDQRLGLTR